MSSTPLFDPPPSVDRGRLAGRLRQLAVENVWIGTSSWKYSGWLGQIYTRENYLTRGRFSRKLFEATCLREYAETFPIVCGDFSFYQFPSQTYWQRLFDSTSEELRLALKVPEQITAKVFASHPRYGANAGAVNRSFLDHTLLEELSLRPLAAYRHRVPLLIFEFGAFSRAAFASVDAFVEELDRFFSHLPKDFRYSVEIRNPEFLRSEYFRCLQRHGIAHVFSAWARMPELSAQVSIREAYTSDFVVCRALLRRGRPYEQAVRRFSPYDRIQEPNPEVRQCLRSVIEQARDRGQGAYIFVNNRLEGNAPATIQAVVEE